ncbi:DUF4062 domain-containing protein [Vibrio parahaemolyticus]|uniref:DUF4062 domain-containing protein n=1 Tax=Vibrio parahaemolyticus TaxID=670 RepID=UPI0009F0FD87|nr:DUF4062 domain-containing protein [Vibrio parahaemolyticus]EGR1699863.1 DUF4062 domain-containing protein [Vibrio parahaemolyticus]MBM5192919.1 DUF4062 domain-containing protein [Vibrio parahaemolyticus]MBM5203037.1 DUF4062 domain-containing protein [Vibrio parahaemolyticus]MBM5207369.1 DUF4062 domain-containing protein [Vibrio parahaemolyticus]MBM5211788.1 DUF4062 domain-containing protein [Vibrio parahaemolyticus]
MKKRLQVFVSSTYIDLIDERQAAVSAILKSGHIPAGMELFTAGDQSQWDIIKRWIDESDVYMLILGGRYGSVEPESGLSYTELEYNYALEVGKPLFAVVIQDSALDQKIQDKGANVIERDHPIEYKAFKEKVLSNMSSFYADEKDIRLCVLESLPEIAATRSLNGWVSGNEVPDTKSLVDEISRLTQENRELSNEVSRLQEKLKKAPMSKSHDDFEETINILSAIEIDFPDGISDKFGQQKMDLFQIFNLLKSNLVTGITNQYGIDDLTSFVYGSICPRLQIHDLVINEKVASVKYRRFALTKKGQELLAYIERKKLTVE